MEGNGEGDCFMFRPPAKGYWDRYCDAEDTKVVHIKGELDGEPGPEGSGTRSDNAAANGTPSEARSFSYSRGAEIWAALGSGGALVFGPFLGPGSGSLFVAEARRGQTSPGVPGPALL